MKIAATIEFTLNRASAEVCDKFGWPYGTIEILDPDGDRIDIARHKDVAIEKVQAHLYQMTGYQADLVMKY